MLRDFESPPEYKQAGFWFLFSSILGRRVWYGDYDIKPLFANLYIVPAGNAGAGKSNIAKMVFKTLAEHKYVLRNNAGVQTNTANNVLYRPELQYPIAPSVSTYESLVDTMEKAMRKYDIPKPWPKGFKGAGPANQLMSNPMSAIVDEIASLFRPNNDAMLSYILEIFDCGEYYKTTKTNGNNWVPFPFFSLWANTTPTALQKIIKYDVATTGFLSRFLVIYGRSKHHTEREFFIMPPWDDNQRAAFGRLTAFVAKLKGIGGQIKLTPRADAYLLDWMHSSTRWITNTASILESYFERKNIIAMKIAMIELIAQGHTDLVIDAPLLEYVEQELSHLERQMHVPFEYGGENSLAQHMGTVVEVVKRGNAADKKVTFEVIFAEMVKHVRRPELVEIIADAISLGKITTKGPYYFA